MTTALGKHPLAARPRAGESDAEIVAGAWNFERINRRHVRHLKILEERPGNAPRNLRSAICDFKSSEAWAAGPDTAGGISRETSLATAGGSAPGRQPATPHVQTRKNRRRPRVKKNNFLLHMQHEVGRALLA